MQIPNKLRIAIEDQMEELNHNEVISDAQKISNRYRTIIGTGERLVKQETEAVAYSVSRMPATYSSVFDVLCKTLELVDDDLSTLIDAGAGTGAGSWAANSLLNLDRIICLERENSMSNVGQKIMNSNAELKEITEWYNHDLINDSLSTFKSDITIASYVLNEMKEQDRMNVTKKLWGVTKKLLVIIEPGTPVGYKNLMKIREEMIDNGAHILSPCTHENICPLTDSDWCHFSTRVNRSKLHMQSKGGVVPFEDEKYSYIVFVKDDYYKKRYNLGRIIKHPQKNKGNITMSLCTSEGIQNSVIMKKKKVLFKLAKNSNSGDTFSLV